MLSALVPTARASADTLTVCPSGCTYTTIADAITAASNGDRIEVGPGTYDGGFVVNKSLTLVGSGSDQTAISGGGSVVAVGTGMTVAIRGVTIESGTGNANPLLPYATSGGGILNLGTLTLEESVVRNNEVSSLFGGRGAGIFNAGLLRIDESAITGNRASGFLNSAGGIWNQGIATLTRTAVSNNVADLGGGIANAGLLTLADASAVTGNYAARGAGGVGNTGTLVVYRSLIAGNSGELAYKSGGGIDNAGSAAIVDSEVIGNTRGGGIANSGKLFLLRSLIAGNTGMGGINNVAPGTVTLLGGAVAYNTPFNCSGTPSC